MRSQCRRRNSRLGNWR